MINGPKGIIEPVDLLLINKDGNTNNNPRTDATNNIMKIDLNPNKKPNADKSLASPNPIASLFLICL